MLTGVVSVTYHFNLGVFMSTRERMLERIVVSQAEKIIDLEDRISMWKGRCSQLGKKLRGPDLRDVSAPDTDSASYSVGTSEGAFGVPIPPGSERIAYEDVPADILERAQDFADKLGVPVSQMEFFRPVD